MELNSVLVCLSLFSSILSLGGFGFALFAFIEVQAQKRSTHTVMPIGNELNIQKLEDEIQKITGQGKEDHGRDFHSVGLDMDELV